MSGNLHGRKQRFLGRIGAAAVLATVYGGTLASAAPNPFPLNADPDVHWFAAWDENEAPGAQDFFPTPSPMWVPIPTIQATFNATPTNKPLGLKIEQPLTTSQANTLFNTTYTGGRAVSWVFSDDESGTAAQQITKVTNLVNQVRNSTQAKNAYVGHYDLSPLNGPDQFRRGALPFTKSQYNSSKVNMANPEAYPGSGTFRNRSTFDFGNSNIRVGLFVGPIGRVSNVQEALNTSMNGSDPGVGTNKHKNIPWVARFNNFGNASLDTDQNGANGYRFVPGEPLPQAGLSAQQTENQMMGRGDFSAQILHYRMRGAYSVNLFHEGGASGQVENYSAADAKQDVRDGWYGASDPNVAHVNQIFNKSDNKPVTFTLNPVVDGSTSGSPVRSETTGTIWSGQYSTSLKKMDILLSNLDTADHLVNFGKGDTSYEIFTFKNPNGWTYADSSPLAASRNALIEAGLHKLLQFDLVSTRVYNSQSDLLAANKKYSTKTIWLLTNTYQVFDNNNRNDVGIPEPTTFGMLAAAGSMAVVCRRQRRNAAAAAGA